MKRLITICLAALISLSSFADSVIPEEAISIQLTGITNSGNDDDPRDKGRRASARLPEMFYLDNYIYIQSPFNIDESQIIIRDSEGNIIYNTIITLNAGVNVLVLPMDVADDMYNIEFIYGERDTLGYF
ncbi:MAG: hypothetical protein Q4E48_02965 [Prevotella sp.]|nr:hypothetical protein [Prevotella sp.]